MPKLRGFIRNVVVGAVLTGMLFGASPVSAQAARTGAAGWVAPGIELVEDMRTVAADSLFTEHLGALDAVYEARTEMETAQRDLKRAERAVKVTEDAIVYWNDPPKDVVDNQRMNTLPDSLMIAVFDAQDAGRDPFTDGTVPNPDAWKQREIAPLSVRLETERAALETARTKHNIVVAASDVALAKLRGPAAAARAALANAGVPAEIVATLTDDVRALIVGAFAEAWADQRGVSVDALPAGDFAMFGKLDVFRPSDLAKHVASLHELPPNTVTLRGDVLGTAAFKNETAQARAAVLRKVVPFILHADDYESVAKLSPESFDAVVETLRLIDSSVGFNSTGYTAKGGTYARATELKGLMNLTAVRQGSKHMVSLDPASFFAPGVEHDWAQFLDGVERFSAATGAPFTVGSYLAVATLGTTKADTITNLEALLERTSRADTDEGYARIAERVLMSKRRGGLPEGLLADLDRTIVTLDRKLSAEELDHFVKMRIEGNTGSILPERSDDAPTTTPIKDFVILRDAPATPIATLRAEVLRDIKPGAHRTDGNAEYVETPAVTVHDLSRAELLKVRALQCGLADSTTLQSLRKIVDGDLANGKNVEFGGLVELGPNGRATFRALASDSHGGVPSYSFPHATESPWFGIAMFHLHAVEAAGEPDAAGPSSARDGLDGDRGGHAREAHDGVVISLVAPGRIDVDFLTASGTVIDLGVFDLN